MYLIKDVSKVDRSGVGADIAGIASHSYAKISSFSPKGAPAVLHLPVAVAVGVLAIANSLYGGPRGGHTRRRT